jgi:predicted kinase
VRDPRDLSQALFVFSGLPGSGKSTLARVLAREARAVYLRIDTIEQGLRDLCTLDVQGEGYRLAYRVASDNLRLRLSVVADSCNPIELTRKEWEQVALEARVPHVNIEVVCSDPQEHRARVESRAPGTPGLAVPTWAQVLRREYHQWAGQRLVIDTAHQTPRDSFQEILRHLFEALGPKVS